MNTQVHETTGHSPYELVFQQKPRTMQFSEGVPSLIKEEDLELDGVVFEDENDDHDHSQQKIEQDGIVLEDKGCNLKLEKEVSPNYLLHKTEKITKDCNEEYEDKFNDVGNKEDENQKAI